MSISWLHRNMIKCQLKHAQTIKRQLTNFNIRLKGAKQYNLTIVLQQCWIDNQQRKTKKELIQITEKKIKWKYVFEHGIAINLKALSKWQSKQKCYRLV